MQGERLYCLCERSDFEAEEETCVRREENKQ